MAFFTSCEMARARSGHGVLLLRLDDPLLHRQRPAGVVDHRRDMPHHPLDLLRLDRAERPGPLRGDLEQPELADRPDAGRHEDRPLGRLRRLPPKRSRRAMAAGSAALSVGTPAAPGLRGGGTRRTRRSGSPLERRSAVRRFFGTLILRPIRRLFPCPGDLLGMQDEARAVLFGDQERGGMVVAGQRPEPVQDLIEEILRPQLADGLILDSESTIRLVARRSLPQRHLVRQLAAEAGEPASGPGSNGRARSQRHGPAARPRARIGAMISVSFSGRPLAARETPQTFRPSQRASRPHSIRAQAARDRVSQEEGAAVRPHVAHDLTEGGL